MIFQSPVFSDARGSIAGVTYSRNRGGLYTRSRVVPTNPNSPAQQAVRNIMSQLTARWLSTLTAAQRTAWDTYAASVQVRNKLGSLIYISGQNHYLRSNVPRLRAGLAVVDAGPAVLQLPEFEAPTFTASEATNSYSIGFDDTEAWASEEGAALLIFEGRIVSASINYFRGPYRFNSSIAGGSSLPASSPETVTSLFTLTEDQRTNLRFRLTRADGRLSTNVHVGPTDVGA